MLRRKGRYRVDIRRKAAVQISYSASACIRVEVRRKSRKRDQLYCPKCGHTQFDGEWEKAMDAKAKAMGSKGFFNLSAPQQCLACGALRPLNISCSQKERRAVHKEHKALGKIRQSSEFGSLVKLSGRIDFPASSARERSMMCRVKEIGSRIADQGGLKMMGKFLDALPTSSSHERLWRDFVSASWDGIEDKAGNRWMH